MTAPPVTVKRALAALLLSAAALFTANIERPSLPSLDDCFYARKGVEMQRRGAFFTVTWAGQPTFQNPPLQPWLLGRSFALLGENDGAARLPSALMALGTALALYGIGRRTVGAAEAVTGVALLLATPLFANNARRCMMESPLAFWVTLAVFLFVLGLDRPHFHVLLALPVGAALLTKSVLGLLPLLVMVGALASPRASAALRAPWLWIGVVGGLLLGASWPLQQWLAIGPSAVREHFVSEIALRAAAPLPFWRHLLGYPLILLERFQPAALLAIPGVALIWSQWRRTRDVSILLVAWIVPPLLLYSLSSAQSPRYVFTLLPALALAGGCWLARRWPRVASGACWAVAALLAAAAVVFWTAPRLLRQPGNDALKAQAPLLAQAIPPGEAVPYTGTRYWIVANPLLYYAERRLQAWPGTAEAVAAARRGSSHLVIDRDRLHELAEAHEVLLDARDYRIVRLR
jgi:4-amino-4-deoxy-L-arabinose transferase-like glycosyltransferase